MGQVNILPAKGTESKKTLNLPPQSKAEQDRREISKVLSGASDDELEGALTGLAEPQEAEVIELTEEATPEDELQAYLGSHSSALFPPEDLSASKVAHPTETETKLNVEQTQKKVA